MNVFVLRQRKSPEFRQTIYISSSNGCWYKTLNHSRMRIVIRLYNTLCSKKHFHVCISLAEAKKIPWILEKNLYRKFFRAQLIHINGSWYKMLNHSMMRVVIFSKENTFNCAFLCFEAEKIPWIQKNNLYRKFFRAQLIQINGCWY